jgi:perosamine synthetase
MKEPSMASTHGAAAPQETDLRPIPFCRPDVGDEEIAALVDAIRSGWLTVGPRTQEFEEAFAKWSGARHALAVSSCTAALHLALNGLGIEAGDEIITTTLTFAATGATIVHSGARPVLADCTPDTLNIDPEDIARKITKRTRALIVVHFAGHPAPMDEIREIARAHGLTIIEDAAHALPATYKGQRIGTISEATCFSFYATKNLVTGEGGMLTVHEDELADRVRTRRLHGMSRDAWRRYSAAGSWRYDVAYPGFKYNMTDPAAAMGLVQLRRLPDLQRRRLELVARYHEALADVPELQLPVEHPHVESAWHLYAVRVRPEQLKIHRDEVIELLRTRGVGTSVHFLPLHSHSYYRETFEYRPEQFPVASAAAEALISLPLYTRMSDDDVDCVAERLKGILHANRR